MLTIGDLIAVISLCLTSFGLGSSIGKSNEILHFSEFQVFLPPILKMPLQYPLYMLVSSGISILHPYQLHLMRLADLLLFFIPFPDNRIPYPSHVFSPFEHVCKRIAAMKFQSLAQQL